MIKTVLFDLGNVILPYDLLRLATKLSQFTRFSPQEVLEKIGYETIVHDFETGRMSPEGFYRYITDACELRDLSIASFIDIFNDIFEEDTQVVQLIERLKEKYQLGLISNTNPIHVSYIKTKYPSLTHFHQLWFSNEAGVRKPDAAIYRLALEHFESQPHETVFIDDLETNIVGAQALGMKALLYQGVDKLKQDLAALGVQH